MQLNPSIEKAYSVYEINAMVSDLIEGGFSTYLWVEGEISNLSFAASGHRYFSLKDERSLISCALFKISAQKINSKVLLSLKNGDQVLVKAKLSVYQPRGSYQLIISDLEPAGFGQLAKDFLLLKEKIEQLGMTKSSHKKGLPSWPRQIAVITSATGAAIRDVIVTLKRRAPFINVIVYPVLVQGRGAEKDICLALEQLEKKKEVDAILLVRGGGSLEDLQAFNSEVLAHKIFNSSIPIITGVGHETDFTIADFVSDYRAATPTAAAEAVSPDAPALLKDIRNTKIKVLYRQMKIFFDFKKNQLLQVIDRVNFYHPNRKLQEQKQFIDDLLTGLMVRSQSLIVNQKEKLDYLLAQLMTYRPNLYFKQERMRLDYIQSNLYQLINYLVLYEVEQLQKQQNTIQKKCLDYLENQKNKQQEQLMKLHLLSPKQILSRGYSIVFDENNNLIRSRVKLKYNDEIKIQFSDGEVSAKVKN